MSAEYCDEHVCLCVCPRSYLQNCTSCTSDLYQIFVLATYSHGSVLLWRIVMRYMFLVLWMTSYLHITPAEAGTWLSDPGGMQGWVDLVGWLHAGMIYSPIDPGTKWAWRELTLFVQRTLLTTTPCCQQLVCVCVCLSDVRCAENSWTIHLGCGLGWVQWTMYQVGTSVNSGGILMRCTLLSKFFLPLVVCCAEIMLSLNLLFTATLLGHFTEHSQCTFRCFVLGTVFT